jgi:diguanylate cyclase (GGDEF)-like protein/PAS domain S-box-containing protein
MPTTTPGTPHCRRPVERPDAEVGPAPRSRQQDGRFASLFQQSGVAQVLASLEGVVTAVNDEALELLGQPAEHVVGQPLLSRVPEGSRAAAAGMIEALVRGERDTLHVERQLSQADGSNLDVLLTVAILRDDEEQDSELSVCLQDVTELRTAQRLAEREGALWRSLSQNAADVALVLDRHLVTRYASPSVTSLLGHPQEDIVGSPVLDLVHPHDRERVADALRSLVADDSPPESVQFRMRDLEGDWRFVEQRAMNLVQDSAVQGLVLNVTDVTGRRELERTLRQAVLHDRLTGLPNRTLTMDRLEQAVERSKLQEQHCALLLVDVDHFKAINDAYGQAGGDQVLRWAAAVLSAAVRPVDTVGRFGPDQFAILLDDASDRHENEALAERITAALNASVVLDDGSTVRLSACVGLAQDLSDAATGAAFAGVEALVSAAEGALSRAKLRGRGQVAFHDGVFERSLGAELAAAVAAEQLTVRYQPIVELRTGRITSFEALVRWRHPELGMVPPDTFLPIARALDLHETIDRWVLRQACSAARTWVAEPGADPTTVAVNVSADRLLSPGFVADVKDALATSTLPPYCLVLEVTETAVVTDRDLAAEVLGELCELGVRVAIDDFGTGYSSMLQLRQLPFATLKIDREFVRALPSSADDLAICATVINLATRLDVRSIAEGVETAEQAAALAALGCEYGQGFLWRPAIEADAALDLLRSEPWQTHQQVAGRHTCPGLSARHTGRRSSNSST